MNHGMPPHQSFAQQPSKRGNRAAHPAVPLVSASVAVLLGLACGPPPKPASLILLENLRAQPYTREVQSRNPAGWTESDGFYQQAHRAWQDSAIDEAEEFTQRSALTYKAAEAVSRKAEADEQAAQDTRRLDIARDQERYYAEEVRKLDVQIASLTSNLATADLKAREALLASAKPASDPAETDQEHAAIAQLLEEARRALAATEQVRAMAHAPERYHRARNLITRAEQEIQRKTLPVARVTLEEAKKEAEAARAEAAPKFEEAETRRKIVEMNEKILTGAQSVNGVDVRKEPRGIVVVASDLFSGGNKASIKEERFFTLDQLAKLMIDFPTIPVLIEGHVDTSPPKAKRETLSKAFADAVREYFLAKGIEATRLEAEGFGDTLPIEENRTAAGRAKNRRVEIIFKLR